MVLAALGAGITTFLLVAVIIIAVLNVEFSAIVGGPVGLLVDGVVFVLLLSRYGSLSRIQRVVVDSFDGFGVGIVLLLGANYVNLANVSVEVTVGIAVVIGVLAGIGSWLANRQLIT